ncbi:MAG: PAS domain S-box protein, partial [Myxococcota bacterium]
MLVLAGDPRAEAVLASGAAAERFRRMVEASFEGVWVLDAASRTTFTNQRMAEILGEDPGSLLGRSVYEFMDEPTRAVVEAKLARRRQGIAEQYEVRFRRADGSAVWTTVSASPLLGSDGSFRGTMGMVADISDRRVAEDDLRRSEERFRSLVEHGVDVITLHEADGTVRWVAPSARRVLGWNDALVGGSLVDRVHPDDTERWAAAFDEALAYPGRPSQGRFRVRHGSGAWRVMDATCVNRLSDPSVAAVVVVQHDVTDRLEMEARLAVADRLASIGTLAAGVAHEINNPLSYVIANLDLARDAIRDPTRTSELPELLHDAIDGADRVRRVVGQLRTLSRVDRSDEGGAADLNAVLDTTLKIADHEIRTRARIVRQFGELVPVRGDPARLGQVFLNLLTNAAHAIPAGDPDRHEIRVCTRREADRVIAEITDTGGGMSRDVRARIFDPFFTTKPVGVGVGLSLIHI